MCRVWFSVQTSTIFVYSTERLVFITDSQRVYCAVQTECLNILQVNPSLQRFKLISNLMLNTV